ncbi:MAG: hypothetical protein ACE5E9_10180 [Nitrospinaceae bacterium]
MKIGGSLTGDRGSTAVVLMIFMTALVAIAIGALQLSNLNLESANAYGKSKKAYYFAEAGLDLAVNDIINEFENLSVYSESANYSGSGPEGFMSRNNYRGYDIKYKITNPVRKFLYQTVVGNSIIYHYAHTYDIETNSTSLGDSSRESLKETIRVLETPLVQYYIFYAGSGNSADLEILPGPTMNSWGRIHSNGDIYIGAGNRFNLRNYDNANQMSPHSITAGGNIYLKRKNNSTPYPDDRVYVKISNIGTTFDTGNPAEVQNITGPGINSSNESAEESRFNDYVLANEQTYSVPDQTLFRRNAFYEDRAGDPQRPDVDGIKIVGTGGLGAGNIQVLVSRPNPNTDVTDLVLNGESAPGNAIVGLPMPIVRESVGAFEDCRESDRAVDTTDIDLYALQQWYEAYLNNLGLSLAGSGFLVYASRSPDASFTNQNGNLQAIRLLAIDGTSSPQLSDDTTLATDNPIYIQGDFNTVDTHGVALVGDAINILSNAFTGKTCNGGLANAAVTTINAAFFGGNVPTPAGGGTYSGGLENYPRFHERWSGIHCNIRGSFINLWTSSQANSTWAYGGDRYKAPNREWGWDVRFQNPDFWPPFIPSIFSIERVGFLE